MSDADDASEQFNWMRQVAYDGDLLPYASRVAIALTKYFNYREYEGWTWMAQATLAKDLGMPERTLRKALSALVKRGHLISKRRGRMETNQYHVALKSGDGDRHSGADHDRHSGATHRRVTGTAVPSDRHSGAKVTGTAVPTNLTKEPKKEPRKIDSPAPLGVDENSGRRRPSDEAAFEQFFQRCPRRVAKEAARKAYRGAIKRATHEQILAGVIRYAAERSGQDPKFTKHPSTWLSGACWDDDPAPAPSPQQHFAPGGNNHIDNAILIARQVQERKLREGRIS